MHRPAPLPPAPTARHLEVLRVRDVRHDDVRGPEGLVRLAGRVIVRRLPVRGLTGVGRRRRRVPLLREQRGRRYEGSRGREGGKHDGADRSHRFRNKGSINVETNRNVARLTSAGTAARPSTFTARSAYTTSVRNRSSDPAPHPAMRCRGASISVSANAVSWTTNATSALSQIAAASRGPENASVSSHPTSAIEAAAVNA